MLNDLENSIMSGLQNLGKLLPQAEDTNTSEIPDATMREIRIELASLVMKLQRKFEEDGATTPIGDEFYVEFHKNVPVVLREIFLFGGFATLAEAFGQTLEETLNQAFVESDLTSEEKPVE